MLLNEKTAYGCAFSQNADGTALTHAVWQSAVAGVTSGSGGVWGTSMTYVVYGWSYYENTTPWQPVSSCLC